jgi:hypothetical protein
MMQTKTWGSATYITSYRRLSLRHRGVSKSWAREIGSLRPVATETGQGSIDLRGIHVGPWGWVGPGGV